VRQQIRAIGEHVDDEPHVAHRQRAKEGRARRDVDIELHDAVVLFAERELPGRAEHAVGDGAADFSLLNLETAGQHRAGHRERI